MTCWSHHIQAAAPEPPPPPPFPTPPPVPHLPPPHLRYTDGQGIGWHRDGELFAPRAAVLSLLSPACIDFAWRAEGGGSDGRPAAFARCCSLLLQPRSLLVFDADAYETAYHGIRSAAHDDVGPDCANAAAAGVSVGQRVQRGARRLSLTMRRAARLADAVATAEGDREAARARAAFLRGISENVTSDAY